ncbi:DUF5988 family protein [Streptomyces sp. WMMC897]|uniref:DUF5988 family protein n=1 Tax=Streptomyces sp. WMMC897 TaxID=3014782 RepID=UPI003FCE4AB7
MSWKGSGASGRKFFRSAGLSPTAASHQHFERSGTAAPVDFDGEQVPVFRFTHSTAIAE